MYLLFASVLFNVEHLIMKEGSIIIKVGEFYRPLNLSLSFFQGGSGRLS